MYQITRNIQMYNQTDIINPKHLKKEREKNIKLLQEWKKLHKRLVQLSIMYCGQVTLNMDELLNSLKINKISD